MIFHSLVLPLMDKRLYDNLSRNAFNFTRLKFLEKLEANFSLEILA